MCQKIIPLTISARGSRQRKPITTMVIATVSYRLSITCCFFLSLNIFLLGLKVICLPPLMYDILVEYLETFLLKLFPFFYSSCTVLITVYLIYLTLIKILFTNIRHIYDDRNGNKKTLSIILRVQFFVFEICFLIQSLSLQQRCWYTPL